MLQCHFGWLTIFIVGVTVVVLSSPASHPTNAQLYAAHLAKAHPALANINSLRIGRERLYPSSSQPMAAQASAADTDASSAPTVLQSPPTRPLQWNAVAGGIFLAMGAALLLWQYVFPVVLKRRPQEPVTEIVMAASSGIMQGRRAVLAEIGIMASAFAVPSPAFADTPIEKPVVVILRCANVSNYQQGLLRDLATGARKDMALGAGQMKLSVSILLRNSKLDEQFEASLKFIPPESQGKARAYALSTIRTLKDITLVAPESQTEPLTPEQLLRMADLYGIAREYMRQFCELLRPNVLENARAINLAMQNQPL